MMYPDSFKIEPSRRTPWVILEPGEIFIMGRSITENPGDFYRPVLEWISRYAQNNLKKTKIVLGFEYINSSSTKWIFTILKELSEMKDIVMNVKVTWYYEQGDEDMCELGFILRSLVECPFRVVEVDEMNKNRYEKILSGAI
ncbi:MAG: DUF1987 domain-containing protein [Bacteroidia bacterium]|nr:DUF1987 domain-containing protein [Bacteroidia bacterium]